MTENLYNPKQEIGHEAGYEADETLRLLAGLPEPDGLTDRVHRRLALAQNAQAMPERRGFWSLWMPARRLQFAGAALLALAVAGSMWSVYRSHPSTNGQAAGGQAGVHAVPAAAGQGSSPASGDGFHSAGAERVPPTLHPIKVPPAPKKKPAAAHAKPSPKVLAPQPVANQ